MNTTKTTPADLQCLIQNLTRLYVGKPEEITVRVQEASDGSAAYFALRGSPGDDSRLVGRDGCHVNALMFLVSQVGVEAGKVYTFRLFTSETHEEPWRGPKRLLDYDPSPACSVLQEWLEALGLEDFTVEVGPGEGPRTELSYTFQIKIQDKTLATALTLKGDKGISVIGAIGTLIRAIGKQNGVKLQLDIVGK